MEDNSKGISDCIEGFNQTSFYQASFSKSPMGYASPRMVYDHSPSLRYETVHVSTGSYFGLYGSESTGVMVDKTSNPTGSTGARRFLDDMRNVLASLFSSSQLQNQTPTKTTGLFEFKDESPYHEYWEPSDKILICAGNPSKPTLPTQGGLVTASTNTYETLHTIFRFEGSSYGLCAVPISSNQFSSGCS